MKRVYILCEGQTEESFVNEILYPYFENLSIYIKPIVHSSRKTISKKDKGGVTSYNKIKNDLNKLCKEHKNEIVTTMFDYYGMPDDTPMISCNELDIYKRIEIIEKAINDDIGELNCFFNFMLHEFEGILFSNPDSFSSVVDDKTVAKIKKIKDEAKSPEHINNSSDTAPSKRLENLLPNYAKVKNGTLISKDIGIDRIMQECKHFSSWIEKIKTK